MDLNAVLKGHTTVNHMATVVYFWNQMLEVVKVQSSQSGLTGKGVGCCVLFAGDS